MYACMVRRNSILFLAIIIAMMSIVISAQTRTTSTRPKVVTNDSSEYRYAFQHGYKAGYEDGYVKGKSDVAENREFEFQGSDKYQQADRTYNTNMGLRAEYKEAYRVGFEMGTGDGYYGRPYTVRTPDNLGRIIVATLNNAAPPSQPAPKTVARNTNTPPPDNDGPSPTAVPKEAGPAVVPVAQKEQNNTRRRSIRVPSDIQMKVRLQSRIDTKTSVEGDKFTVVVLDPTDYADAIVEGHIGSIKKSGKATGKTEIAFVFDTITLRDGRTGTMDAQLERVLNSENVKEVDEEGNVKSGSRGKDTATRAAGVGALGAIIGAVAGGGKGAAIGAIIGASVGAGSVLVQDGKHLILEPGTEILIRTTGPEN